MSTLYYHCDECGKAHRWRRCAELCEQSHETKKVKIVSATLHINDSITGENLFNFDLSVDVMQCSCCGRVCAADEVQKFIDETQLCDSCRCSIQNMDESVLRVLALEGRLHHAR